MADEVQAISGISTPSSMTRHLLNILTLTFSMETPSKTRELQGSKDALSLKRVLRSPILPALHQPWTTVAKELTQPGEVPQHVKDRLVSALGMLPSTLGKENQGFHDWSPRLKAVAETFRKRRTLE